MSDQNQNQNLKASEVALLLGCSKRQVYRLYHRGELDGHRVGEAVVFYAEGVEQYMSRNRNPKANLPVPQLATPKAVERKRTPKGKGPGAKVEPALIRYFGDLL